MSKTLSLKQFIRAIPDFPKPGILFRDITPLLNHKQAFGRAIKLIAEKYRSKKVAVVVAVEARGFILGGAVAEKLGARFVPVRKKGKLPWKVDSVTYELEYGTDSLEMHQDSLQPGDRVLIVDDLLATGGTIQAVGQLVKKQAGKIVGVAFLIELSALAGRRKLEGYPVSALIKY